MDLTENAKFLEKARRELSAEELTELKLYEVTSPAGGKILFMPIVRKWGGEIYYQARVHFPSVAGCLRLGRETVRAAGFPDDYLEKSRVFLEALNEAYSPLLKLPKAEEEAKQLAEKVTEEVGAPVE